MCLNLWTVFLSFPNVFRAAFRFGLSPVLTRLTTFVMSLQACSGVLTKVNKTFLLVTSSVDDFPSNSITVPKYIVHSDLPIQQ